MTTSTALLLSSLVQATATGVAAYQQKEAQKDAMDAQKEAQTKAENEQKAADEKAEKKRLEGLASSQTTTDYGNIWGTDSAKYSDAAQKLSAGTGSFNTDEDENPFYTKGLL